jgi:hypothetical protein
MVNELEVGFGWFRGWAQGLGIRDSGFGIMVRDQGFGAQGSGVRGNRSGLEFNANSQGRGAEVQHLE